MADTIRDEAPRLEGWGLVLGASSGFGEATSLALARAGLDIFGVHLDRRASMSNVERIRGEIRGAGRQASFFNINAADEGKRAAAVAEIREQVAPGGKIRVMLHSLAFGTLRPFVTERAEDGIKPDQMEMTIDVMGNSLVYWTQELYRAGLLGQGSRIFAMTSTGSWQNWPNYGAVGAAKAALEAHVRQLAVELAPRGIAVNAICAGVTDTPALRKIPGHASMLDGALRKNPSKRLTTPQDVANAIVALSARGTDWLTGNVINVDGGEAAAG